MDDTRGLAAAYVRFDLSGLPAGLQVDSATLELLAGRSTDPRPVHKSRVHLVEEDWTEATLHDERGAAFDLQPAAETTVPVSGQWATWDVTDVVRSWRAGVPNYGLGLTTATGLYFQQTFASRESDTPPRLVIDLGRPGQVTATAPVATPASTPGPPAHLADLTGWAVPSCSDATVLVTVRNTGDADAVPFAVRSRHPRLPGARCGDHGRCHGRTRMMAAPNAFPGRVGITVGINAVDDRMQRASGETVDVAESAPS
jgi:hypothetical protein